MGGSSSGGGGGGAPQNAQGIAQRMASRRVQKTAASKGAFVTSGKNKNIVRDSSGKGVIAGQRGARIVEQARQAEVDRLYKTPEAKTEAAIRQLETRKAQAPVGILGAISRANINQQIEQLQSGTASPQFTFSTSGNIVTTGVRTGTGDGGTTNIAPIVRRTGDGADMTPEITPEVTPEIAPDDTSTLQTALLAPSKTRRTKYKRFGGAGSQEETGLLVRT